MAVVCAHCMNIGARPVSAVTFPGRAAVLSRAAACVSFPPPPRPSLLNGRIVSQGVLMVRHFVLQGKTSGHHAVHTSGANTTPARRQCRTSSPTSRPQATAATHAARIHAASTGRGTAGMAGAATCTRRRRECGTNLAQRQAQVCLILSSKLCFGSTCYLHTYKPGGILYRPPYQCLPGNEVHGGVRHRVLRGGRGWETVHRCVRSGLHRHHSHTYVYRW
jgi:hypothetical protein